MKWIEVQRLDAHRCMATATTRDRDSLKREVVARVIFEHPWIEHARDEAVCGVLDDANLRDDFRRGQVLIEDLTGLRGGIRVPPPGGYR